MDFFTHLLVGIVLGRLFFKDPNKQEVIALGSILPDFDIFLAWIPSLIPQLYVFSHRGFFHSILTLIFTVPIGFVLLNKLGSYHRLQTFRQEMSIDITIPAYFIGLAGSYLHLSMDLLNPQGVVLFSPLSEQRYTLSTMNFIEPAVSIPATLIILVFIFRKYYKKQNFNIKRFDIYSRVVSVTFVVLIILNSVLMAETVSAQKTDVTTPSYLFTQRWVIVNQNDSYSVKLVDQLSQQTIREFTYNKTSYNSTEINSELQTQILDNAMSTTTYKKYTFTLDPETRLVTNITKGEKINQWIIEFTDIISYSQGLYYGLPKNSFLHNSIEIKVTMN